MASATTVPLHHHQELPSSQHPDATGNHHHHEQQVIKNRRQEAAKLFKEIDIKQDDKLDKNELFEALRKLDLPTSKSKFDKFFKKIDKDGDNFISRAEFENFVVNRYQELEEAFALLIACGEENEKAKLIHQLTSDKDTDDADVVVAITATICTSPDTHSSSSANTASMLRQAVQKKYLTAESFRKAAKISGSHLSDADLTRIMSHLDATGDDRVSFQEFVSYMMLCPFELDPAAFFNDWWKDALIDTNADFTVGRELSVSPAATTKDAANSNAIQAILLSPENKSDVKQKSNITSISEDGYSSSTVSPVTASTKVITASSSTELQLQAPPSYLEIAMKKLVCGGAAGAISRTLTAPIDRIRILMMTATHRISIMEAARRGTEGGVLKLFSGNASNVLKVVPETALKLFIFEELKNKLAKDPKRITFTERLLSGALAGLIGQSSIYPLEVVRTRMAVGAVAGEKPYNGILDCIRRTYREGLEVERIKKSKNSSNNKKVAAASSSSFRTALGGVKIFYSGIPASALGVLPFAGIDLSLNSYLKDRASDHLKKKKNREVSVPVLLACGMISSSIATVATFPLNVIRTKAQANGDPVVKITREIFTKIDHQTGLKPGFMTVFKRLYVGTLPAVAKISPATAISYTSFEWFGRKWSQHDKRQIEKRNNMK